MRYRYEDRQKKLATIISVTILIVIFLLCKTCRQNKSFIVDNLKPLYFGHYKEQIELNSKNKKIKYYFEISTDKTVKYDIKLFSDKLSNTIPNQHIQFRLVRNNEYIFGNKDNFVKLDSLQGFPSLDLFGTDLFVKSEEVSKNKKNKYLLEVLYNGEIKDGNYLLNLDFIVHDTD